MSRIPLNQRYQFYAGMTTQEELKELSKDFKKKYREFIKNFVMQRGCNRHELFNGWFFNDDLFVRISCNQNYKKLYFNFYDRNSNKSNRENKKKYKKYLSLPNFYSEFSFSTSPNQDKYLQISSSTFRKKFPENFFNLLNANLKRGVRGKEKENNNINSNLKLIYDFYCNANFNDNKRFALLCLALILIWHYFPVQYPSVHRLIMACCLEVKSMECVHHLEHSNEEYRQDNRFENLVVTNEEKHSIWHKKYPNIETDLTFDPTDFEVDYATKEEIETYWKDEIEVRNNAYKLVTTLKEGNYAHKTENDEVLFKICYYSYIKKLTDIKCQLVGLNERGSFSRGTLSKIKKKYISFIDYFIEIYPET